MQYRQAQEDWRKMHLKKKKNCGLFFCIVGFCNLVVFVSLWDIMLCRGAEVAFVHAVNISKRLAQLEA